MEVSADIAWLVECLPGVYQVLGRILSTRQSCDPSTKDLDLRLGAEVQSHPQLCATCHIQNQPGRHEILSQEQKDSSQVLKIGLRG